MIVVDASVVIAFLDDLDAHHAAAREVVMLADTFGVHTINLAETLVHGIRTDRVDEMAAAIAAVSIRELPRVPDEPQALARTRARTGLRLPDCCVVVASEANNARLATFDSRLARAARARGIEVLGAAR